MVTFSDHLGTIEGTVDVQTGQASGAVAVFLFPADSTVWTDAAVMLRRFTARRLPSPQDKSTFVFDMPPDGDYLLVAFHDQVVQGGPMAEKLAELTAIADRIQARQGTTITHSLAARR